MRAPSPRQASPRTNGAPRDVATRRRLLEAATRLFAERGLRRVTVREICDEARANVAAVNYHFGDKERLYREVLEVALDQVRDFTRAATSTPAGASAEDKLARYIFAHLTRAQSSLAARRAAEMRELFRRELSEPTAYGAYIVEQALKPRLRYLAAVIAELAGPAADAAVVERCAMSVQAQCLLPVAAPVALTTVPRRTSADLERLARHVLDFSLGGIRTCVSRPDAAANAEHRTPAKYVNLAQRAAARRARGRRSARE